MNNLQSLNALIEQTIQEIDEEVIEISSIDALYEISEEQTTECVC